MTTRFRVKRHPSMNVGKLNELIAVGLRGKPRAGSAARLHELAAKARAKSVK
jgi:hypothetical protein